MRTKPRSALSREQVAALIERCAQDTFGCTAAEALAAIDAGDLPDSLATAHLKNLRTLLCP